MSEKSCFILGMPEAGKTTFLAALWYCVNYSIDSILKLKAMDADLTYLSDISTKWSQAEQVSRTKLDFEKKEITLSLESKDGSLFKITFPDLSGETFQAQYEDREVTTYIANYIKRSQGILLFINPKKISEPNFISEVEPSIRDIASTSDHIERDPKSDDPTQVQLVELLQFINYIREEQPVNLGIIISAWDVVEGNHEHKSDSPEEFVCKRLPLLWQYVASNSKIFKMEYFGISAQGGEISGNCDEILDIDDPCKRVIVVDNNNRSHDITLPLFMVVNELNEK